MHRRFSHIIYLVLVVSTSSYSQQNIPTFTGKVINPEDPDFVGDTSGVGSGMDSFDAVVGPIERVASSELETNNGITYKATNAYDWNLATAWVPKSRTNGIGEWLQYTYDRAPSDQMALTSLIVFNGYRKSRALWNANARVRDIRLLLNGKPYAIIHLQDSYNYQTVALNKIPLSAKKTVLRFEILSVYKGTRYQDVAITELELDGEGAY